MSDCSKYTYEMFFRFEKTPMTKYTTACVVKSSLFSKFKVFMTVDAYLCVDTPKQKAILQLQVSKNK